MALEVRLEVEDIDLLGLRDAEELTESGIRVDVLLVVEALGLDVVHDATRDIRTRHERTLGLAEEDTELVRDLRGLRENRGLLGELLAVGIELGYPRAAAAAGTLELAAEALLHLLALSKKIAERVANLVELRDVGIELSDKVDLNLGLSSGRRRYRGGDYGGGGGRYRGSRLAATGTRSSDNRGSGDNRRGGGGYRLRGLGGGLWGSLGAHFILVTGFI